ncbi:conjugative transposon protein TraM [Maribellus comscasis]|uniref:Conjugative transposon protein TraM n=1 Tax=Maribellus comscasis TaxID=2681766 RepID=A0A6I6K835_9BACT|nr:conjugative transposon protein TraM [Maribellus comscasis]QGY47773.1 conjugative transposon protein TraM [Maribellus comscasis]
MKQYLKRNKALFILPLALIPFVVLIFYVLGGGTKAEEEEITLANSQSEGANYLLPEAEKSIEIYDKMEAYQKEGTAMEEGRSNHHEDSIQIAFETSKDSLLRELPLLTENKDPEELLAHIRQKEEQIKKELNGANKSKTTVTGSMKSYQSYPAKSMVKRQQKAEMPKTTNTGIEELDQIVDQNINLNRKSDSLMVSLQKAQTMLQQIEASRSKAASLEKKRQLAFGREEPVDNPLIKAEIYETTTVLDGNRVKLRLLEDTYVNGQKIPENAFIYGICNIKNERLHIEVTQMPVRNSFVPVKLSICDLDGLEGLYVPDNAARKVYQEVGASTNTSSLMGVTGNPLTYAGIRAADRAAQTILKRVRLKKVTVKKNTLVYIINQK